MGSTGSEGYTTPGTPPRYPTWSNYGHIGHIRQSSVNVYERSMSMRNTPTFCTELSVLTIVAGIDQCPTVYGGQQPVENGRVHEDKRPLLTRLAIIDQC